MVSINILSVCYSSANLWLPSVKSFPLLPPVWPSVLARLSDLWDFLKVLVAKNPEVSVMLRSLSVLDQGQALISIQKWYILVFSPWCFSHNRKTELRGPVTGASIRHDYHLVVPGISQGRVFCLETRFVKWITWSSCPKHFLDFTHNDTGTSWFQTQETTCLGSGVVTLTHLALIFSPPRYSLNQVVTKCKNMSWS